VYFGDSWHVLLSGGTGVAQVGVDDDNCGVVYLAASLRNAGNGIGVLHGWRFYPEDYRGTEHADPDTFTRQTRDLYLPPGDIGFWQGAFRDPADPAHDAAAKAIANRDPLTVDLLYGDYEGGQRVISRFLLRPGREDTWLLSVIRHWNVDRPDPR
jgi:hypothetical protein